MGKLFDQWEINGGAYNNQKVAIGTSISVSYKITVKALWGELGNPIEYKTEQKALADAYADLPQELKDLYTTENALKERLFNALYDSGRAPQYSQVQYFNVYLYVKPGGVNWEKATLDNFPSGGSVTARINYPESTNKTDNVFFVSHIFQYTSERLGTTAGEYKARMAICTDDGIEFSANFRKRPVPDRHCVGVEYVLHSEFCI